MEIENTRRGPVLRLTTLVLVNINNVIFPSDTFFSHTTNNFKSFIQENVYKYLIAADSIKAVYGLSSLVVNVLILAVKLYALLIIALKYFISHSPLSKA